MSVSTDRIIKLIKNEGLSLNRAEAAMNIAPGTLSRYRLGSLTPSTEVLLKVSRYFGVSVDYLLGLTDDKNWERTKAIQRVPIEADEQELIACYRVVKNDSKDEATALLVVARTMAKKKITRNN